jgi:CRP-like cAMP-binding protein
MYEVGLLGGGKHFGELALTTNKPRAATIKCITNTHLMVLSRYDYEKVLLRFEEANLNKFTEFLK